MQSLSKAQKRVMNTEKECHESEQLKGLTP